MSAPTWSSTAVELSIAAADGNSEHSRVWDSCGMWPFEDVRSSAGGSESLRTAERWFGTPPGRGVEDDAVSMGEKPPSALEVGVATESFKNSGGISAFAAMRGVEGSSIEEGSSVRVVSLARIGSGELVREEPPRRDGLVLV